MFVCIDLNLAGRPAQWMVEHQLMLRIKCFNLGIKANELATIPIKKGGDTRQKNRQYWARRVSPHPHKMQSILPTPRPSPVFNVGWKWNCNYTPLPKQHMQEGGVVNISFTEILKDAENRRVSKFILQAIVCLDICIPPSPDSLALQLLVLQLVKHI